MDARARMESRRKKILENAEARMSKILGKPYVMPAPRGEKDGVVNCMNNGLANGTTSHVENEDDKVRLSTLALSVLSSVESVQSRHPAIVDCIFFILLGLLTRLCYDLNFSWIFNNNFLYPFFVAGGPWTFLISKNNNQINGTLSSFLLLIGVHQEKVFNVCKVIAFFRILSQFFSLFIFSFVLFHCFIESIPQMLKP